MPAPATLQENIEVLIDATRRRRFCIVSQSRCDRSCESFIASQNGFRTDLSDKDRKAIFRKASAFRRSVEKGGAGHGSADAHGERARSAAAVIVVASAQARAQWDTLRKVTERTMEQLAAGLPGANFVEGVRGFGPRSFAVIVGEAGNLSNYATPSRLWKRLGLAVIDGERQRRKTDAEAALKHGFNPQRRSEMWVIADSLFRAQWSGADGPTRAAIVEAHPDRHAEAAKLKGRALAELAAELEVVPVGGCPKGPYGEVYARRRARTAVTHPDWTRGHAHSDAVRVMSKQLLVDLWVAWRRDVAAGSRDARAGLGPRQ